MKRMLAVLLILCLFPAALLSCTPAPSDSNKSSLPESKLTESSYPEESTPEESSAVADGVYPPNEPPLSEYAAQMPVPDFLDAEQQLLFRRAYDFYRCFRLDTAGFESMYPNPTGTFPENPVIIVNGKYDWPYYQSAGRYQTWKDFEALALSICTKEFFDELNGNGTDLETYINVDGLLYHICGGRGGNIERNDEPDSFELVSRTDERIDFNIIGYYYDMEKYTEEEWIALPRAGQWDYIKKFPAAMEKTDEGWRVALYNLTF